VSVNHGNSVWAASVVSGILFRLVSTDHGNSDWEASLVFIASFAHERICDTNASHSLALQFLWESRKFGLGSISKPRASGLDSFISSREICMDCSIGPREFDMGILPLVCYCVLTLFRSVILKNIYPTCVSSGGDFRWKHGNSVWA